MFEIAVTSEPTVAPGTAAAPDCMPTEQVRLRYMAVVEQLIDEAKEQRHLETLAEVLTFHLATIGCACGVPAIGDIARRLGGYVGAIAEREAAQREVEAAKQAGLAPH